jgi:hypothetical protein
VRPGEPLRSRRDHDKATAAEADFLALLADSPWDLAMCDGVTDALAVEGFDILDNADFATWARLVPKRSPPPGRR